jgi:hypothetical protein
VVVDRPGLVALVLPGLEDLIKKNIRIHDEANVRIIRHCIRGILRGTLDVRPLEILNFFPVLTSVM